MTGVFLDTVGLIAVWDSADQWHVAAEAAYRKLLAGRRQLITTSLVLIECGNAAARRPYRNRVNALRQALIDEELMVEPTSQEIDEAWRAYDRGDGGMAGIVDQVSFIVMRRLGIVEAFTNDRHFQGAGLTILF